eukprot:802445-Amphidinium_carterae.1
MSYCSTGCCCYCSRCPCDCWLCFSVDRRLKTNHASCSLVVSCLSSSFVDKDRLKDVQDVN